MKRKDCKPNTPVIVRGVIDYDDKDPEFPIKVNFLRESDEEHSFGWFNPEQLINDKEYLINKKRKFYKKDKVRYMPSGRECYIVPPKMDKIYEVVFNEGSDGWIYIKGLILITVSNGLTWSLLSQVNPF